MTTLEAMYCSVCEHRGDDTPRLLYADWLEEHDLQPERVEFIRLQVDLARKYAPSPGGHHPECREERPSVLCGACEWVLQTGGLRRRAEAILHYGRWFENLSITPTLGEKVKQFIPNKADWLAEGEANDTPRGLIERYRMLHPTYVRGFVGEVALAWGVWEEHGDKIAAVYPVQKVTLATWPMPTRWGMFEATIAARVVKWDLALTRETLDVGQIGYRHLLARVLSLRWPGIEFDLTRAGNLSA